MTLSIKKKAHSVNIEAKASVEKFKKDRFPVVNYFEMGFVIGDVLLMNLIKTLLAL